MNIFFNKHNLNFYNTLLSLSRNIFFYNKIKLSDTLESRLYLIFFHFSILMIISKQKRKKFDQKSYDNLFNSIEYNFRELGFGDVTVNKKMKDLNKILYDILLKINDSNDSNDGNFNVNFKIANKYFHEFSSPKSEEFLNFNRYFTNFFHFCFELSIETMLEEVIKFKDKSWLYQKEKHLSQKKK